MGVFIKNEVSVVGAGTAGLIAAKELSLRGVEVSVYDQKKVLGTPVRASGILSIEGLRSLDINYSRAVTNTLYGAEIHGGGRTLRIVSKKAVAHVLDRKALNDLCHDEAVSAGATVELGKRLSGEELGRLAEGGVLIGADGAVSSVARHFSMGEIKRYAITYKAEFEAAAYDERIVHLFFDNEEARGLFGWICPNSSELLEVGIGIDSRNGNCKAAFERFMRRPEVLGAIKGSKRVSGEASMIPMALRRRLVDPEHEVLLVGDAAGQVKPSTGGGIVFGGNAAKIAAEVVKSKLEGRSELIDYERRYRRRYRIDTWIHSAINIAYSSMSNTQLGLAISASHAFGIDAFLGRYGDMDMPTRVIRNLLKDMRISV